MIGRSGWHRSEALARMLAFALVSIGCADELWPVDGGEPALGACFAPQRAPTLSPGGERTRAAATDEDIPVVDLTAQARGGGFVRRLRLSHGVGTIELGCEAVPMAVYLAWETDDTPGTRYYRAIAVDQDRVYPMYLSCGPEGLGWVYYSSTDGSEGVEWLEGECLEVTAPVVSRVTLPALDMPLPSLLEGYRIDGPSLTLREDGRGTLDIDAATYEIFAFQRDDCTEDCGPDEYRRIELLLSNRTASAVSYAELYFDASGASVDLRAAITLPGLGDGLSGLELEASFTIPAQ